MPYKRRIKTEYQHTSYHNVSFKIRNPAYNYQEFGLEVDEIDIFNPGGHNYAP